MRFTFAFGALPGLATVAMRLLLLLDDRFGYKARRERQAIAVGDGAHAPGQFRHFEPDELAHLAIVIELDHIYALMARHELANGFFEWQRSQAQVVGGNSLLTQPVTRLDDGRVR